jgi:methanogenic corrinoid protein MtbC1
MAGEAKYRVGITLRMWEKRYAAVLPKRTEAGGRLYNDADVERLRLLHKLVQSGHSIGGIANLPDGDLRGMTAAAPATSIQTASQHLPELRDRVMAAIERLRIQEAEQMLTSAALSTEPSEFLKSVVAPILVEVGERWERGELRIAHEHACSTLMRGLLFSLMRLYPANDAQRRVVVGTPAKEDHELGAMMVAMLAAMHGWSVLMMVAMLAAMHGWSVLYLGPDLPAEEIAYAVNDIDADLLMLSVTNLGSKKSQREIAAIESEIADRVRILVGGSAAKLPPGSRAEIQQDLALVEAGLSR